MASNQSNQHQGEKRPNAKFNSALSDNQLVAGGTKPTDSKYGTSNMIASDNASAHYEESSVIKIGHTLSFGTLDDIAPSTVLDANIHTNASDCDTLGELVMLPPVELPTLPPNTDIVLPLPRFFTLVPRNSELVPSAH